MLVRGDAKLTIELIVLWIAERAYGIRLQTFERDARSGMRFDASMLFFQALVIAFSILDVQHSVWRSSCFGLMAQNIFLLCLLYSSVSRCHCVSLSSGSVVKDEACSCESRLLPHMHASRRFELVFKTYDNSMVFCLRHALRYLALPWPEAVNCLLLIFTSVS